MGTITALHLQLPNLLSLHLTSVIVESAYVLAACLSPAACPRLRSFSAAAVVFKRYEYPSSIFADMPRVEHFELQHLCVNTLRLRAPRLMDFRLIDCSSLQAVTLLPDGELPVDNIIADAADMAVTVPARTVQQGMPKNWVGLPGMPLVRICRPGGDLRIEMCVRSLGVFQQSQAFLNLIQDLRICAVTTLPV